MLKGDARMATVLHNAVYARLAKPSEPLVLNRGSRRWRVTTYELHRARGRAAAAATSATAPAARCSRSGSRTPCSPRWRPPVSRPTTGCRTRSRAARRSRRWSTGSGRRSTRCVSCSRCCPTATCSLPPPTGVLTDDEQALLLWPTPPRGPASARWSSADAVLIDEARDVIERTPSLGHVVLDEAQDLSPMQLRAVGPALLDRGRDRARRPRPGHHPVGSHRLGDHPGPPRPTRRSRRGARARLSRAGDRHRLRQPAAADHRARGRGTGVGPREPRHPRLRRWRAGDRGLAAAVRSALRRPGSVGVIVADDSVAQCRAGAQARRHRARRARRRGADVIGSGSSQQRWPRGWSSTRSWSSSRTTIVAAEPSRWIGLRRLYVVLTRAVSGLTVVHSRPLPAELGQTVRGMRHLAEAWLRTAARVGARDDVAGTGANLLGQVRRPGPALSRPDPPRRGAAQRRRARRRSRAPPTSYAWPRGSTTRSTTRVPTTTRSAARGSPSTCSPTCASTTTWSPRWPGSCG